MNDKLLVNEVELIIDEDNEFIINDNDDNKPIDDVERKPTDKKHRLTHQQRSKASKQRRNRKRNKTHRMRRYQHYVTRPMYHKFTTPLVKKILQQHNIKYVHIKEVDGILVIGVKNDLIKQKYQKQLPEDLFDRTNYQIYQHHQPYHRQNHRYHPE
ncbi:unnamed protein product [Rotaria sp. Silwood2]|nr:unnamed protein product [Rotaria sp. Silwood2]CAF4724176.1 unnamed protein product [Rotaria sp. Silwood2]